jgi:hypothetical protein
MTEDRVRHVSRRERVAIVDLVHHVITATIPLGRRQTRCSLREEKLLTVGAAARASGDRSTKGFGTKIVDRWGREIAGRSGRQARAARRSKGRAQVSPSSTTAGDAIVQTPRIPAGRQGRLRAS